MKDLITAGTAALVNLLEREAGYHLVSLALIATGVSLLDGPQRAAMAHDLIVFGTGVLARSMGGKKNAVAPPAE